jgi:hypothetical protein
VGNVFAHDVPLIRKCKGVRGLIKNEQQRKKVRGGREVASGFFKKETEETDEQEEKTRKKTRRKRNRNRGRKTGRGRKN